MEIRHDRLFPLKSPSRKVHSPRFPTPLFLESSFHILSLLFQANQVGEVIRALGQNPTQAEVSRLVQNQKKGDRVIDFSHIIF